MANAAPVSDFASNAEEQIENAAKAVGKSPDRRSVFEAIYHGRARVKTVAEISARTGLSEKRVLEEGRKLAVKHAVLETKKDSRRAYEKIDSIHAHKRRILSLAGNRANLAKWPTKRKVVVKLPDTVRLPTAGARVKRITIDDIDSFSKVKGVKASGMLEDALTEGQFKHGVQAILDEPGTFKDWGGEPSDLYSTRLMLNGKRRTAAFAFKGPGLRTKLVPGKMGKNGDQVQRLFHEDADVYLVQHCREIASSVTDFMQKFAIAQSVGTGKEVWYGIIDGKDSERVRLAYPEQFDSKKRKKGKR